MYDCSTTWYAVTFLNNGIFNMQRVRANLSTATHKRACGWRWWQHMQNSNTTVQECDARKAT